ncbi:cytochrome P450 [Leptolyngbya sp. Heron Island J]|uniref:cytochrome P450 n=1 Tax=Leptolyngbya sp. Heron Island J TaxID=1385935 RepID=UPI0004CE2106|nr:cytochrome P450 [Leptolyngbya sp. Heron Island J]
MVSATAQRPQAGHLRAMRQDMIGYLEGLSQQGDFLKIPLGLGTAYYLNHPDDIREVLVTQAELFHKPSTIKYAASGLFGENLFTTDGRLWKVLRQTMQPAFQSQQIRDHAQIMIDETAKMVSQWHSGQMIEICQAMMDLTMGITSQAFFGVDLRDRPEAKNIVRFIELFNQRISGIPVPAWVPLPATREMKTQIAQAAQLFDALINERRHTSRIYTDILAMLVAAQASDTTGLITDQQVRNEVMNLFAAGYEVTANSLAFALHLIDQYPTVETRLRAEIDQILGNRAITFEDLTNMPYLECVLKESMRLMPVTAVFARQATQTVTWADRTIPKNAAVLISPWTLHRRSDIYPDSLTFDPDRFDISGRSQMPKFAYLPFSGGTRICIGQAFAMTQMRINLATILQRYRLSTTPDYVMQPYFSFNTRPQDGLPMQLQTI